MCLFQNLETTEVIVIQTKKKPKKWKEMKECEICLKKLPSNSALTSEQMTCYLPLLFFRPHCHPWRLKGGCTKAWQSLENFVILKYWSCAHTRKHPPTGYKKFQESLGTLYASTPNSSPVSTLLYILMNVAFVVGYKDCCLRITAAVDCAVSMAREPDEQWPPCLDQLLLNSGWTLNQCLTVVMLRVNI